ncbi:hypothetical protein LTR37_014121 [Vermiconidia calcicola]|uniref:Uncharacterized protein n=1 Tax=Vermiconidia calcicola TaxID=1690605 RepID=A0ACC3MUK0_9PEZI|nr:hypothetical protein LTR37_014121 [Vermiconidia calcicola]
MAQPLEHSQHRGLTVATHPLYSSAPDHQAAHAATGLAIGTNNTYTAAPRAGYAASSAPQQQIANNWSLPQEDFSQTQDLGFAQDNAYGADDVGHWQQVPQSAPEHNSNTYSYPDTALPPRSQRPLTPDIRVTTTDLNAFPGYHQQAQDLYSAASASSTSSYPLREAPYQHFTTTHLSPQTPRYMNSADEKMQHTPPVSPHSPQLGPAGDQSSRKRRHSEMSGDVQAHPQINSGGHSRAGSVLSLQQDNSGEEEFSPRSRTIKRADPPTNAESKYVCNFSTECNALTFDRKCEWSKHMDKHDRPYRCPHASCAKLQGFTYSGGLLRHEREVHGKHGGPKAQLICPYEDCKRHSGKGFTRKENLNEHIRRVHHTKDMQSQHLSLKQDATDALAGAEESQTPASHFSGVPIDQEDPGSPMHKRRRFNLDASERSASEDVEDLKQEVMRLRSDNAAKDNRLLELELRLSEFQATEGRRQEEMRMLQESMRQLQHQGQGQV